MNKNIRHLSRLSAGVGLLMAALISASEALACDTALSVESQISIANRKLMLIEQTIIDNRGQSTLNQKFLVTNPNDLNEPEVKSILTKLFERAKNTCRKNSLQGTILFLYTNREVVHVAGWVGRLDTEGMKTVITVDKNRLPSTASHTAEVDSSCEKTGSTSKKKSFSLGTEVSLPPVKNRKIVGTWDYGGSCTMSFEEVKGKLYRVLRCADCSGGSTGDPMTRSGSRFRLTSDERGEYYTLTPDGNLSVSDSMGVADIFLKHSGLWPR